MKHARLRWLVSWRAMAVLGLAAVVAALLGVHAVQARVEARVLRTVQKNAQLVVTLVVGRNITPYDVTHYATGQAEERDMDADVASLAGSGELVGLEVWSLADGRRVYTDYSDPLVESALDADELARARTGSFSRSAPASRVVRSLDVFIPFDPAGGQHYVAVAEVRLPSDPIVGAIRAWTIALYAGAGLAVALAFIAIAVFRRRHTLHEYAARHDALTGLGNRLLLTEETKRVLVNTSPVRLTAVLLLDLDGFKEVNDTLGHDAGDQLLVTIAHRLHTTCATAEAVIRLGGDEFVVLLSNVGSPDEAVDAAERIRHILRRPIVISGLNVEIDASVGVSLSPQHGDNLGTLLKRADVAMYDAKRSGAGVVVYDLSTDSREAQHLSVLAELRSAIDAGELRLYYQPKSRPDGRIDEVEALIRWQHPRRGLLPPSDFVPLAERTSLIKPLTAWVLQEAARQVALWRADGQDLSVAVNVSARNLVDDDLIGMVESAAAAAGIPIETLRLEITETAVMTDPDRVHRTLKELRAMDVQVSIDDFGVGYTSLSYLSTLPVHALKIDRQFVTHLLENPVDEVLVRNIIQLAHDLGLASIAEGVESHEVWQRLCDLGCDEIQGYILTRPLPPQEFRAWLDRWRTEPSVAVPHAVMPHVAVPHAVMPQAVVAAR